MPTDHPALRRQLSPQLHESEEPRPADQCLIVTDHLVNTEADAFRAEPGGLVGEPDGAPVGERRPGH